MTWAADEFATVDLGDKRLNSRLVKLAEQLGAKPTASIPAACGGWGDTAAAYRMLDNERCDWREIIEAHGRCTVQRMTGLAVALCLHDTTELDFNGQTIQGIYSPPPRGTPRNGWKRGEGRAGEGPEPELTQMERLVAPGWDEAACRSRRLRRAACRPKDRGPDGDTSHGR